MQWQAVAGWDSYEVSRCGQVRKVGGTVIGQWKNSRGYPLVRLARPRAQVFVHRLVAFAFIPNPLNLPFVNHLDCNPANNAAENLEWCTQQQNLAHSASLGRMQRDYWVGKRSSQAKLTDAQAEEIRTARLVNGYSLAVIAAQFGTSKRTVGRILNGESYV